jgi:hypothetical protein
MTRAFQTLGVVGVISLLELGAPLSIVQADALVTVQLKDAQGKPADGKVELSDAQGKVIASCEAKNGQCELHDVPGGSLTVTVQPAKGAPPKPRKVMIPPSGKVSLVVATS